MFFNPFCALRISWSTRGFPGGLFGTRTVQA